MQQTISSNMFVCAHNESSQAGSMPSSGVACSAMFNSRPTHPIFCHDHSVWDADTQAVLTKLQLMIMPGD